MLTHTPQRIVLLGPYGSGKGTQATVLSKRLRLPVVTTGDILWWHTKHRTTIGRRVGRLLRAGRLIPDSIVNKLVAMRLRSVTYRKGYILDGYPRTIEQAQFLNQVMPPTHVIAFSLPIREAVRRMSGRRIGPDGTIFHLVFNPPPKHLLSKLKERHEDRPAIIRRRLQIYRRQTLPLLRYYRQRGALAVVDARPPIPSVTRAVVAVVKKMVKRTTR